MADLLRALARDPATIWRRRLIAGGAVAATAAAFVIGSLRASATTVEPCSGAHAAISEYFSPERFRAAGRNLCHPDS